MSNNRGVTLLYVLMALLAVSFIGLNLINLAGSDSKAGVYMGVSEVARSTTLSGHTNATTIIETDKTEPMFDSIMIILNEWLQATSLDSIEHSYLIGDSTHYVSIPNTKQKYKVKISGFDVDNLIMAVEVEAESKGHAKAKNTGLYYLDGLEIHSDTTWSVQPDTTFQPMAAFKLGGNTDFESNCDVRVVGMTYIKGKLTTNSCDVIFDGPFYQDKNTSVTTMNGGILQFRDIAYLGGHWDLSSSTTAYFEDKVGFEGGISAHASDPSFYGTIYHNGRHTTDWTNAGIKFDWAKHWDLNFQDVYSVQSKYDNGQTVGTYMEDVCYNPGMIYHETSEMDILDSLGMPDKPADLEINDSILNSVTCYYTNPAPTLTYGDDLTATYIQAVTNGDTLCGGFVVIREHPTWDGNPGDFVVKDNGSKIDGKIIYVWTRNHSMKYCPSTTHGSNFILLSRTNQANCQLGVNYMRGILFVDGAGIQLQPKNPTIIDGATYYSPSSKHYNNSGGGVIYKYNEQVLQETSCLGIISDPNDSTISEINQVVKVDKVFKLKPGYTHIETKLMSRSY